MIKHNFLQQVKDIFYFVEVKRCRQRRNHPNSILFPVIWVTNRCNLRCNMCDCWKTDNALLARELTTGEWKAFIDSASRMHTLVIIITGGEPLLRPDIFQILRYISERQIAPHLCTNGTLIDKNNAIEIRNSKLNSISISLDSHEPKIHNSLRGVDCFDTVIDGIRRLKCEAPQLKIGINYLINKRNFRNMYKIIPFAERLGVDQIKFDIIHTNLMHRKKNIASFEGLLFDNNDLSELRFEIDKLIRIISRSKLLSNSSTFMHGISDFCSGDSRRFTCYAGYISCAVSALGLVSPCDNFEGIENLRNSSFEKIWKSPGFQLLREKVHNCNHFCWDSTHGEINIRCSLKGFFQEFGQIVREMKHYANKQ